MKLIAPIGGLSDALSFEAQALGTTTIGLNTSSLDPVTNRVRFGPRAGSERYNENKLNVTGKVQRLAQATADNRRVTYAARTTSTPGDLTEAETAFPSGVGSSGGVADGRGNIFVLDGPASVVKYNSALVEVWRFTLPVTDEAQIIRAIQIDPFGTLYFAVSEGGDQEKAALWAYGPDDDKHLSLRWKLLTKKFIEQMLWQNDLLFCAVNDTDTGRSYVVAYQGADLTIKPQEVQRKPCAHPIGGLAAKSTGDVVSTHPANATRWYDPRVPQCTYILDSQRWHPSILTEYESRIHCWLSGDTIADQIDNIKIQDGDAVRVWRDQSGKLRDLYEDASDARFKPPTYRKNGLGMRPGITLGGDFFRMVSKKNAGVKESQKDVQGTLLPGHENCGYVLVMVVKPAENAQKERLLQQTNTVAAGSREIWINTDSSGGAAVPGAIELVTGAASGTDPDTDAANGYFTNQNSAAIITVICENGHIAAEKSAWRVNGVPLAQFVGNNFTSGVGVQTILGCQGSGSSFANGFTGDVYEIFVLRDYTPTGGVRKLIDSPLYDTNKAGTNDAWSSTSDTEIERIEGYFAWKYGISHLLDDGLSAAGSPTWGVGGGSSEYKHPFTSDDATQGPPNPAGRFADTLDIDQLYAGPLTVKYSPQRMNVKWVMKKAGAGSGIALSLDEAHIYTVGRQYLSDTGTFLKIDDGGASASVSLFTGYTSGGLPVDYDYDHARIAVDKYGNVHVPFHWTTASPSYSYVILDGTTLVASLNYALTSTPTAVAVIIDPRYPDYGTQAISRPENVYVLSDTDAGNQIHKVHLVSNTISQGSARSTKLLGVCGGIVKSFVAGSSAPVAISGTGTLTAGSLVCAIQGAQQTFFLDGSAYVYYDATDDMIHPWTATSAGEMPARARWGCKWNGRIVLIRADDPANWHMSAFDDPFDWDQSPAVVTATQAISGNNAAVGKARDIIVTVISLSDYELLFVGDHTVNLMRGDPMAGGTITEISNETGGTFGPSWCRDDDGTVYLFGNKGAIYRYRGGTLRKMPSEIEQRLKDIDLNNNYVELAWNSELDELWIGVMPYGAGGSIRRGWIWQKRIDPSGAKGWHEYEHDNTQIQPACFFTYDADSPDDRAFLWGREDGYVSNWLATATADDGYPIKCEAMFTPLGGREREWRVGCPTITLASDQGGCRLEMFSSDTYDDPGEAQFVTDLVAGRNETSFEWIKGAVVWLKFSSGNVAERWAYESGDIRVVELGRARAVQ